MKLKTYVSILNDILKENPTNGDLEVVYSIDDEGNAFHKVNTSPCTGNYNDRSNEFDPAGETKKKINAICIN